MILAWCCFGAAPFLFIGNIDKTCHRNFLFLFQKGHDFFIKIDYNENDESWRLENLTFAQNNK